MNDIQWTVLDNSNIVESYPGITLPLTYSFARIAYRGVFRGVARASIKNEAILSKYDDIFDNMIKSHEGRLYYCINNWYSLIDFMPFSKKIIPVWQDMMGVTNQEIYLGRRHNFTPAQKIRLYFNMLRNSLHIPRDMERLDRDFRAVRDYFDCKYSESLSVAELLALFDEIERRVLAKWHVTLSNDLYAFIWTGLLKRGLKKKGCDVTGYISGISSLESLKPVRALLDIAQKYGGEPDLLAIDEVKEYLKTYGDRSPCELKLEVMTYREDPALLLQKIRDYASDKTRLDEMIDSLRDRSQPHVKGSFALRRARTGIKNREASRLNRSRIYGMVRRIFITVGQNLCSDGHIDEPHDVFYLEIDDIRGGETASFRRKIAERKAEFSGYESLPSHSRLVFRGDRIVDEDVPAKWTGGFNGVGVSRGSITAQAVVLDSPNGNADVRGKIIVTQTTDPGWVFLLTAAGGIVAEKGSMLSHTAIVSRELKIPAVVAVESAVSVIKTGDVIRIDGDTGRVEIVRAD